jgi:translation initiation factor 3 subunit D
VEKVSVKSEIPLVGSNASNPNPTASEDSVLKKLESEASGNTVIITDTVLAVLMASTRSVYSWDLSITKKGNKLVIDKRENSSLEQLSVNENSMDPPTEDKESMNSSVALCMEATFVDKVFKNQSVNPVNSKE